MDFTKFDKMVDVDGLKADIEQAKNNNREYEQVPLGEYEVEIEKMELGESGPDSKSPGSPMLKVQFRIIAGDFERSCLFMNQVCTRGFQIHIVNEFLDSLGTGYHIEWDGFETYGKLIDAVFAAIDGKKEYRIEYGEYKTFKTFKVKEIFELE